MPDVERVLTLFKSVWDVLVAHGDEYVRNDLVELRDRALRASPANWGKTLPADSMYVEARAAVAKIKPERTVGGAKAAHKTWDAFDTYGGPDVTTIFTESAYSKKYYVNEDGIHGLPTNCPFKCPYCSRKIGIVPWTIYKHLTVDGKWECTGLLCSPGCLMRTLESKKLPGYIETWKSNSALVIRRRLGLAPSESVPIAPHIELMDRCGGPIPEDIWYEIADGFRTTRNKNGEVSIVRSDIHTEWAQNGWCFGKEGAVSVIVRGKSDVNDFQAKHRWIMGDGTLPSPNDENESELPALRRRQMREVHKSQRSSILFNDPRSEEAEGGRDREELLRQHILKSAERIGTERTRTKTATRSTHGENYMSEQIIRRDETSVLDKVIAQRNENKTEDEEERPKKKQRKIRFALDSSGETPASSEELISKSSHVLRMLQTDISSNVTDDTPVSGLHAFFSKIPNSS